jgi:uncharacterized protein YheU (UPF0270 family)
VFWFFFRSYGEINLAYLWKSVAAFAGYKILGVFFNWYYNAIVMTNESLIFVNWKKLFHRSFVRIDFHNLDEIEVETKGIKSFILNYGILKFQKINGGGEVIFSNANHPSWTSKVIEKYREEIIDNKNFTEESALKNLLSQMVQRHVGENGQPDRDLEQMVENLKSNDLKKQSETKRNLQTKKKGFFDNLRKNKSKNN